MSAQLLKGRARLALFWLGPLMLAAGLLNPGLWSQWHPGRVGELLILSLLALGIGATLARWSRLHVATVLPLAWLVALAVFAGPVPTAATTVFALACAALGGTICPRDPLAQQGLVGAVILAGLLGWLLQLPLHHPPVYLLACATLVAWRHRALAGALKDARVHWQSAVAESPRAAAFALVVLGLASTGSWPPTVQFDDLAYHLALPWQLQVDAIYRPDPRVQVWALAPWATDVLQAVPQVMSGQEARGPVNVAWLALMACGVWRLARQLGAEPSTAWLSVALVASLPLTAALAGGMHTELPTAAALVWLAVLASSPPGGGTRIWIQVAILSGGLVAMKTTAAAMACVVALWAAYRHPWPRPGHLFLALCIGLVLAASSYLFAYLMAGNPVLPLFNAWFGSPFFGLTNTMDVRWQTGFDAALPWAMTFHTHRYIEGFDGGGGFALVALAGAWLVAVLDRELRGPVLVATAVLLVPLVPVQYLRYAYPGTVLLIPLLAVAARRAAPRSFVWLAVGLCVLNLAFQANGHWTLRTGIVKQTVLALGNDAPIHAQYAPERALAVMIRAQSPGERTVLVLSQTNPAYAEFSGHGRSPTWYAPGLQAAAAQASRDESGQAWAALFAREQVGDIILRRADTTDAQRRALALAHGEQRAVVGDAEWWSLPE